MLVTEAAKEMVKDFGQATMQEIILELQKRAVWLREIAEETPPAYVDETVRRFRDDSMVFQNAADALTKLFAK